MKFVKVVRSWSRISLRSEWKWKWYKWKWRMAQLKENQFDCVAEDVTKASDNLKGEIEQKISAYKAEVSEDFEIYKEMWSIVLT